MRGLNKLYWLKIDIENIKDEIKSLPTISSSQTNGMPHGSGVSKPVEQYLIKKEALIGKLNQKIERYTEELARKKKKDNARKRKESVRKKRKGSVRKKRKRHTLDNN